MPRLQGQDFIGIGGVADNPRPAPAVPPRPSALPTDWQRVALLIAEDPAQERIYWNELSKGNMTRAQLNAALIEKDRLLQQLRGGQPSYYSGRGGWPPTSMARVKDVGGWAGSAPTLARMTPDQIEAIAPDLQAWLHPTFSTFPFSPDQPTLNMQNTDWASIAPQYRPGVDTWFRAQGLQPAGSLGQYGYNAWAPKAPAPFQFNQSMVDQVPDESLRAWIQRLLLGKGWMAG